MRRRPLSQLVLSLVLVAGTASAPLFSVLAGPAEDKATARELAKQGIELENKGDCPAAIDKLERAESLFHAPPHLQHLARCYTKLGRLVDATEAWRKLTLEVLPPTAPDVFKAAVSEANTELPKLEPRLAHLTIKPAESYPGLEVIVDGKGWPSAALDVSRVIDPGKHDVNAKAPGRKPLSTSVTLPEGGTDTLELKLEVGAGPSPSGSTTAPTTTATGTSTATGPGPKASPLRTVGLVVAGVGAAVMIGGGVTGLLGQSKYADLEKACPGKKCPASYDLEGEKKSIHGLETLTNVFLIGGGVLLAGGLTTFLLAPKAPTVGLVVAPTTSGLQFGLSGHF